MPHLVPVPRRPVPGANDLIWPLSVAPGACAVRRLPINAKKGPAAPRQLFCPPRVADRPRYHVQLIRSPHASEGMLAEEMVDLTDSLPRVRATRRDRPGPRLEKPQRWLR
jgi:hypothetical protein